MTAGDLRVEVRSRLSGTGATRWRFELHERTESGGWRTLVLGGYRFKEADRARAAGERAAAAWRF